MANTITLAVKHIMTLEGMIGLYARVMDHYGEAPPQSRKQVLDVLRKAFLTGEHAHEEPGSSEITYIVGHRLNRLFPELGRMAIEGPCQCGHFSDLHGTYAGECLKDDCDCAGFEERI